MEHVVVRVGQDELLETELRPDELILLEVQRRQLHPRFKIAHKAEEAKAARIANSRQTG